MRKYNYDKIYHALLTPEIVALLVQIHEFKGEQNLFIKAKDDTLKQFVEVAKIQSTEASNKIEGISTSDERLKKIVRDKTMPKTRNEEEIAGYRDVLATIHENHDFIPPKPSMILQLHRDLHKFSGKSSGGSYKSADNVIAEEDAQSNKFVRFQPVPAWRQRKRWSKSAPRWKKPAKIPNTIRCCSFQCLFWIFSVFTLSMTETAA